MHTSLKTAAAILLTGVSGCVVAPAGPPVQPLLVAYPGQGKTEALFHQDDVFCQVASAQPQPSGAQAAPGAQGPQGYRGAPAAGLQAYALQAYDQQGQATAPVGAAAAPSQGPAGSAPLPQLSPGQAYLRCMAFRGNVVQPLQPSPQVAYATYLPYPIYANYDGYYPWLYGGYFGFGYGFGGYGFGGFGYRDGFYRGYGGFRDGGFRDGGSRDGGFRDGGFRDGGFRDGGGRGGFGEGGGRGGFGGGRR